jgi:hypothetical protein
LYELLQAGHKDFMKLFLAAQRAMKVAGVARKPRPNAPTAPRAAQRAATPQKKPTTTTTKRRKRKWGKSWLQYLTHAERRVVDAVLPTYLEYERLKKRPAELDAWLAEDEQGSGHAPYKRLRMDWKEYRAPA